MLAGLAIHEVLALTCVALLLDAALGEPARWHPLVGFGRLATVVEAVLNRPASALSRGLLGVLATAALVGLPAYALFLLLAVLPIWAAMAFDAVVLCFAIGARSLHDHLHPVAKALAADDLANARLLTSRVVSRDLSEADASDVARAAVESALENGNDAVFGALIWFAIAGAPGALAYRLANTLDAMWGYRTPRLERFGWAAARFDDLLNLLPARWTALAYATLGNTRRAFVCWRRQAAQWSSPNAGPVMAAGAGALQLALGGPARYHGIVEARPALGEGEPPRGGDIERALQLVRRTIFLWLAWLTVITLAAVGAARA